MIFFFFLIEGLGRESWLLWGRNCRLCLGLLGGMRGDLLGGGLGFGRTVLPYIVNFFLFLLPLKVVTTGSTVHHVILGSPLPMSQQASAVGELHNPRLHSGYWLRRG